MNWYDGHFIIDAYTGGLAAMVESRRYQLFIVPN
jgi:hypothetical protein